MSFIMIVVTNIAILWTFCTFWTTLLGFLSLSSTCSANAQRIGCSRPWTLSSNIGLNMFPLDSDSDSDSNSDKVYSTKTVPYQVYSTSSSSSFYWHIQVKADPWVRTYIYKIKGGKKIKIQSHRQNTLHNEYYVFLKWQEKLKKRIYTGRFSIKTMELKPVLKIFQRLFLWKISRDLKPSWMNFPREKITSSFGDVKIALNLSSSGRLSKLDISLSKTK